MHGEESIERLLEANERSLLDASLRKSSLVSELLSESFLEFGSSGRVYTKAQIVAALLDEPAFEVSASSFNIRMLAPGVALVTYRTERHAQPPVRALRSSIWAQQDGVWKMLFHQGTPIGESAE